MAHHTSWPHDQLGEHLAGTEPFMLRRFEAGGGARAAGFLAARAAYSLLLLSGGSHVRVRWAVLSGAPAGLIVEKPTEQDWLDL
jgi:hypothetical protein